MNREPETEARWEYLNGLDEHELVEEIKLWAAAADAKREQLVQEVIRLSDVIDEHQREGRSNVVDGMVDGLRAACRRLARWIP